MALAERIPARTPKGNPKPRIAPPTPARSLWKQFHADSAEIGIDLFPWQDTTARYVYAVGPGDKWLYPEVAVEVGRQNGKTEFLVPHIVKRLRMGRRIMHAAQTREVPREVFGRVAQTIETFYPELLPSRRGRKVLPRLANGQEEIATVNGGHYRVVASNRGGARGPAIDDLIVDEVRELLDNDFVSAAEPTQAASTNPQTLWLSSAGDEASVVLQAIKKRAGEDRSLAWLEWSASPERTAGDIRGWLESNPAIGHMPNKLDYLRRKYETHKLAGTLSIFEAEYLCRWVVTLREQFVDAFAWSVCESELPTPRHPYLGVSMDPSGTRASAALAWRLEDESIGVRLLYDVTGSPIDTDAFGADLRKTARTYGTLNVGFDPMTDAGLAKFFAKSEPITGQKYANASARFATAVQANRLRWQDADAVTDDLTWTTRKAHDESGSFQAVRADDDRPITAALAAIRAVWLAAAPKHAPRIF